MSPAGSSLAAGASLTMLVFATVTARHFVRPDGTPAGMRVILAGNAGSFALLLTELAEFGASFLWIVALVGEAAALALFVWTAACTRFAGLRLAFDSARPERLIAHGPYARIRHPFYTAYLMFWSSAAVGIADVRALLVPATMLILYARAARWEERGFASSRLADAYRRYAAGTGMFAPRIRAPCDRDQW